MSPPAASAGPGQTGQGSGGVHQNGGAAGGPSGPLPPPGLSEADVKLLLGKAQAGPDGTLFVNTRSAGISSAVMRFQHPRVAHLELELLCKSCCSPSSSQQSDMLITERARRDGMCCYKGQQHTLCICTMQVLATCSSLSCANLKLVRYREGADQQEAGHPELHSGSRRCPC